MADGALNQSMDEILAQIRKIIAEEPGSAVAAPVTAKASVPVGRPVEPPSVAPPNDPEAKRVVTSTALPAVAIAGPPTSPAADAIAATLPATSVAAFDDFSDLVETDDATQVKRGGPVSTSQTVAAPVVTPKASTSAIPVANNPVAARDLPLVAAAPIASVAVGDQAAPTDIGKTVPSAMAGAAQNQIAPVADSLPEPVVDGARAEKTVMTPVAPPAAHVDAPIVADKTAAAASMPTVTQAVDKASAVTPSSPVVSVTAPPPPVSLSALFANRVDTGRKVVSGGLPVPKHIGRTGHDTKANAAPVDVADVSTADGAKAADVVTSPAAITGVEVAVAPVAAVPPLSSSGSALGALAAGLAASGLVAPSVSPVVPATRAPSVGGVALPQPDGKTPLAGAADTPASGASGGDLAVAEPLPAAVSPSVDQVMMAIKPILQDWLDANMSRVLEGALREALPDLIARAKSTASKSV